MIRRRLTILFVICSAFLGRPVDAVPLPKSLPDVPLEEIESAREAFESLGGYLMEPFTFCLPPNADDEDLSNIPAIRFLCGLDLGCCQITDAGICHLSRITHLDSLSLFDTRVTNVCVPELARMRRLSRLDLRGTRLTDDGVRELQRALPNCKIER